MHITLMITYPHNKLYDYVIIMHIIMYVYNQYTLNVDIFSNGA